MGDFPYQFDAKSIGRQLSSAVNIYIKNNVQGVNGTEYTLPRLGTASEGTRQQFTSQAKERLNTSKD